VGCLAPGRNSGGDRSTRHIGHARPALDIDGVALLGSETGTASATASDLLCAEKQATATLLLRRQPGTLGVCAAFGRIRNRGGGRIGRRPDGVPTAARRGELARTCRCGAPIRSHSDARRSISASASPNFVAKFVANCPDMRAGQAVPAHLSTPCAPETTCIRLTFNPKVVGSNPTGGIEKWLENGRFDQTLGTSDLKSVGTRSTGSPTAGMCSDASGRRGRSGVDRQAAITPSMRSRAS
jgi:hypothetical protein